MIRSSRAAMLTTLMSAGALVALASCGSSAAEATLTSGVDTTEVSMTSKVVHNPRKCQSKDLYCMGLGKTNTGMTFEEFAQGIAYMHEDELDGTLGEFMALNQWDKDEKVPRGYEIAYVLK